MPICPQCKQSIMADAVTCPHCRLELKAHGHPGIPLHRATANTSLCDTCTYHHDDSCNFPQRPTAQTCTLYQDANAVVSLPQKPSDVYHIPWWRKYTGWIALGILIGVSLLITLVIN
ncbi:MAG: zinc ribbon domain-containing protein [Cyanobacteria bacterium P01_G01_bin.38]